jgi:hypothetical protein
MGAACTATKTGDEIWIIAGSNFPFILRHLQNEHYEPVGEAYVRCVMNREALQEEDSPGYIDIILEWRSALVAVRFLFAFRSIGPGNSFL